MGIEIKALSDLLRDDPNALYKVHELHQMLVQDVPDPAPRTKVDYDSWRDGYSSTNPHYLPEANFMALHNGAYVGLTSLWGLKTDEKLYPACLFRRSVYHSSLPRNRLITQEDKARWRTTEERSSIPGGRAGRTGEGRYIAKVAALTEAADRIP